MRAVVGGARRTVSGSHASAKDADVFRDAWNAELDTGGIVATDTLTLAALGDEWLTGRELHGSRVRTQVRSIRSERSVWRSQVASSPIAAMHPASIRTRDVEDFALSLRSRTKVSPISMGSGSRRTTILRPTNVPLSHAMQKEALRLVRGVLDEAVRRGLVATNPAEKVGVAAGRRPSRDLSEDWLRMPEVDALLGCEAIDVFDRTVFATAIGLALRLDDLKALEVKDVFLDAEVPGPHVRVFVQKSERHHRVPVPAWLDPWLRHHLASLPARSRYLFPNPDGSRYCKGYEFGWAERRQRRATGRGAQRSVAMHVTPSALERAGVKRKIRFHDLRGTTATHLALGTWGRTWSLQEVQAMLAHSDQRVTERYVRRAVDSLAEAMKATRGGPGMRKVGAQPVPGTQPLAGSQPVPGAQPPSGALPLAGALPVPGAPPMPETMPLPGALTHPRTEAREPTRSASDSPELPRDFSVQTANALFFKAPGPGLEPGTIRLTAERSTN